MELDFQGTPSRVTNGAVSTRLMSLSTGTRKHVMCEPEGDFWREAACLFHKLVTEDHEACPRLHREEEVPWYAGRV